MKEEKQKTITELVTKEEIPLALLTFLKDMAEANSPRDGFTPIRIAVEFIPDHICEGGKGVNELRILYKSAEWLAKRFNEGG